MPNVKTISELRKIFGRSLKDIGTRSEMGQGRLAKQLGNLVPGSKIYVSGAMSRLPGHNIAAFNRAEEFLTKKGFQVLNPASMEKVVPGQYPNWARMSEKRQWGAYMRHDLELVKRADAVLTMERGSFGTLKSATLSRGAKQEVLWAKAMNKPVMRASRVDPNLGPMNRADPHAKPRTDVDRQIEYQNAFPERQYASIDPPDKAAGAIANPWDVETIPLSNRVSDRSARIGGRRAQDEAAKVQADLRAARGEDAWNNTIDVRRNPIQQDREILRRQNLRRNAQVETVRSVVPGRPVSNTNPAGGRIAGMPEGGLGARIRRFFGFGSPWRGIIAISKEITALYSARLGGKSFGGLMGPSDIRSSVSKLKQYIPRKSEALSPAYNKFLRHKLAQHAVQLRAAKRAGFENAVLIPKGAPGRKGLRATIVHERVHQVRKLEGSFDTYYGRDIEVGKEGADWLKKIGYSEGKVKEEAIAFGAEFRYAASRSVVKVGHAGLENLLNPLTRIMKGDIAGDLMDYAKFQKASSDIRPYIKKRAVMQEVQKNTLEAMDQVANAQTRFTVPGITSSLHQSRGVRKGPSGGNG